MYLLIYDLNNYRIDKFGRESLNLYNQKQLITVKMLLLA